MNDKQDLFRIISLEGGGIRGVFSARLLRRLAAYEPSLLQRTALYAGTSTGGIIALGLAAGMRPGDLEDLYRHRAKDIFRKRLLGGLWGAKYSSEGLHTALQDVFGDTTLRELRHLVLIPAFDLDAPATLNMPRGARARFFTNPGDPRLRVVDAAMATSAAPTYFPSHQGMVDGGLVCNNPAACAVAEALKLGVPPANIRVLAVGTGLSPTMVAGEANDWGLIKWAPKLAGLMIGGSAGVHEHIVATVFADHAETLSAILPRPIDLDDVDAIDELLELADRVDLAPTLTWARRVGWLS